MTSHPEYIEYSPSWTQIHTCLKGERAIKKSGQTYLPYPIETGILKTSQEFLDMYSLYLQGAHYVNFTEEARTDLVNSAFRVNPIITPEETNINVLAATKKLVSCVVSYGRSFLLADYPAEFPADTEPHPYILVYEPLDVLDWATSNYSGDTSLTYVLLRELKPRIPGETLTDPYQYRELLLDSGVYKVRIKETQEAEEYTEFIPTTTSGSSFNSIPGLFAGANDNDPSVDQSPILGISNSNIAHYQTWAELTSATVYLGSPTLSLTGLPSGFIKQVQKNNAKIKIGADLAIALEGDNSKAELLEINPDLTHYNTLEKLEASMAEQGFSLRSNMSRGGAETATTVQLRQASQMSKLGTLVNNTEDALNTVLEYATEFGGTPTTVELNRDFFPSDICSLEAKADAATTSQQQNLTKAELATKLKKDQNNANPKPNP